LTNVRIPRTHPRYKSLMVREKLVKAYSEGIVVAEGLIAHGRGEAFDYILGEKSHEFALNAEKVAVASMLLSKRPVISVNGNYAVLAAEEIARLSSLTGAPVEVNLFYRTEERVRKIYRLLKQNGVSNVLPPECEKDRIQGLDSMRGIVCRDGIGSADFVLVAIEDGDRTQALTRIGKRVAAIDLNPFSRTAQAASITIVDEAARATKNMAEFARRYRGLDRRALQDIVGNYDNRETLKLAFKALLSRLSEASQKGVL